jgi:hypothetical protein
MDTGTGSGCIGFTDSTLTVPCPRQVSCEVRVQFFGRWRSWKKMCTRHASFTIETLSQVAGYEVERRNLQ